MGILIRPPLQTAERWLDENGREVTQDEADAFINLHGYRAGSYVVAVQDLGRMSVGHIVFDEHEKDTIPKEIKSWWIVEQGALNRVSELHRAIK